MSPPCVPEKPNGALTGHGRGTGRGTPPVPHPLTGGCGGTVGGGMSKGTPEGLPDELQKWSLDLQYRVMELEQRGMERGNAITKVRAEHKAAT